MSACDFIAELANPSLAPRVQPAFAADPQPAFGGDPPHPAFAGDPPPAGGGTPAPAGAGTPAGGNAGNPPPAGGGGGAPPPLPAGTPGETVLPCKWKLHIKVHSQERFWPKDAFTVEFGPVNPAGGGGAGAAPAGGAPPAGGPAPAGGAAPPDPLIPPIGGPWYQTSVKMEKVDSNDVLFCGADHKEGGITALVHNLKKEADWVLVDGIKSQTLLDKQYLPHTIDNGQVHNEDLFIRHPLKFYLEFKFKDPEKKIFPFPKDFPIQVWDDKQVVEKKTDEKGRVEFEVDRKHDWVTLKFGNGPVYFSVGDGKACKCDLKVEADRKDLTKNDAKFFGPPDTWGLVESIWNFSDQPKFIDGTQAYKDEEGKIYLFKKDTLNWVRRVGEKDAPITLTLDPNWTFNRLEFFDRYYGHTDHAHARVNVPPMLIEGVKTVNKKGIFEGSGQWVVSPASIPDAVLAVPWIRQKTDAGKKAELPDKDCHLRFKTDADTFSVSSDANTRKWDTIPAGDKRLNPGVDRLKLYDLPPRWESKKYWTRLGKADKQQGKFWEDWTAADYLRSRAVGDPLIFSLDDIVITDTAFNPVKLDKKDRFAFLYHRFKPDYDQTAKDAVSPNGVIKPDANEPYFSSTKLLGDKFNYLTDYPNWVRLIAGVGCLYDAFDKRTVSDVLGARAGVKWYDPVVSGIRPPKVSEKWPKGVVPWQTEKNHTHFIIEPYYGQQAHRTDYQYLSNIDDRIGRFDMALVRNCDRLGAKEFFLSMQYFRLFFNFLTAADAATLTVTNNGTVSLPSALAGGAQTTYKQTACVSLMDRWNGNDNANKSRAEIVPQDNTQNLTGEILWFVQPAVGLPDAHFRLDISNMGANARASMGSSDGTGTVDDTYAGPAKMYNTANAYVLGHELGHAGSMPDEYGEWWNNCSHNKDGISCNSPGDAFVDEGRDFDLAASLYSAADPPYPIMTMTVEMRNRYFWHNAEFARKFINQPMFAKYGAYPQYKVPGHPAYPRKTYTYWPIGAAINQKLGAKGQADIYLHAAGKERFTQDLLPKGTWDSFLSLLLKLALYETTANASQIELVRDSIRSTILAYNQKYYGSGTASVATDTGNQNFNYARTVFRFSPRFLIDPIEPLAANAATYAADVATLLTNFKVHFTIDVKDAKAGTQGFNAKTSKYDLVVDYADPSIANTIASWTEQYFREMVGLAYDPKNPNKITAGDLKSAAGAVFTSNGDVKDL